MRVLAVVVTHNRRELLSRCVDHLQGQVGVAPDILVINNASTDGTDAMLLARGVDFLTQENVGSAGGWHRGIEVAVERGYGAVWLMDDDGYPDKSALQQLVAGLKPGVACASAVVVCEDQPTRFVFPFPRLDASGLPRIFAFPRKITSVEGLAAVAVEGTYPFAHFFNGALINLAATRQVGNVEREFFIFGDEVDYFFRLRRAGEVRSVVSALHYHPDVSQRPYTPAKIYYYVRNTLVLNRRYFNAVWLRNAMAIVIALGRTARRNGLSEALSYVVGRNAPVLRRAVASGLQGKLGKDFDG